MHGQGHVIEKIQVHEMILMPMAQPDSPNLLVITQRLESLPVRGRVDQDARAFDEQGMTIGVFAVVLARDKPDGSKASLFHRGSSSPRLA